jgi:carboxyl-terminal processing protease
VTVSDQTKILDNVDRLVRKKYFDPAFNGRDWASLVQKHRNAIISALDHVAFEREMNALLSELGTSHTAFFDGSTSVPSRNSINATYRAHETHSGRHWVFQDVQPGGPADRSGIKPGDTLLTLNDYPIEPPQAPEFKMNSQVTITVLRQNWTMRQIQVQLATPRPKYPDRPYAEPENIAVQKPAPGVGYMKVSMFPGIIGVDFANSVDRAIAELSDCERLIVDLRGNPGGGIGGLRLMSYLTPGRVPVGYSLTRRRAERGYRKEKLPQFRGIPKHKWELPFLGLRYIGRDQSIVVVTEGRGRQKFHNRIALLVNEHTAGAAEMLAGFVRENHLGTVVGVKTAGRLLGGKGFKLSKGYMLTIPIGCYLSWGGVRYEGAGVEPDVHVDWLPETACQGIDNQVERALAVVRAL